MQELPASTHMHEHHPMFQSSEQDLEQDFEQRPVLATHHDGEPLGPTGLVSPMEEVEKR